MLARNLHEGRTPNLEEVWWMRRSHAANKVFGRWPTHRGKGTEIIAVA